MNILTQEFVFAALAAEKNGERFSINLSEGWKALGYSKLDAAEQRLESYTYFVYGTDYVSVSINPTSKKETYLLSVDTYKTLALIADTKQGHETRRYFIEVEKAYRASLERSFAVDVSQPATTAQKLAQAREAVEIAAKYKETFGAFNPQTEAYLKDIIGNVLMETNKLLGGTTELWMGVVNFAQVELDYTVPKKGEFRDSALGTWIRFYYPQLSDRQERRFCNETQRDIWVYPIHEIRNELTEAVHAFFSDTAPGTRLKLEGAFKRDK